jgi:hypothetical protein
MSKYCRTGNCEALASVPVNLPVWKCIRKRTQQTDIMLQTNQGPHLQRFDSNGNGHRHNVVKINVDSRRVTKVNTTT